MKFTLLCSIFFLSLPTAFADMAPVRSHQQELGNGKYLLVMIYPKDDTGNRNNQLNDIYPQSGLYRNDGSRELIWSLPGPFGGQVFLSDDANSLGSIVFPAEPKGDGVRFYHKGKLVRAYKIEELTRPDTVQNACPSCLWHGKVEFDQAAQVVAIAANDGRTWRFDLRTGDRAAPETSSGRFEPGAGWLGRHWVKLLIGMLLSGLLLAGLCVWKIILPSKTAAHYD